MFMPPVWEILDPPLNTATKTNRLSNLQIRDGLGEADGGEFPAERTGPTA